MPKNNLSLKDQRLKKKLLLLVISGEKKRIHPFNACYCWREIDLAHNEIRESLCPGNVDNAVYIDCETMKSTGVEVVSNVKD